jgi:alpha-1,2-mannosyltransferase
MSLLGLLLLLLLPLRNNVMIGQINILVLLFITLAFYAYVRELDLLAGASLGIAVMIKVSPAILVFLFLAQRRYRTLIGLTMSVLACIGISIAMGAASAWAEFPAFMLERMSANEIPALGRVDVIWNFSFKAFFLRLLPESPTLAPFLAVASALGILGVLIYASVKTREIAGSTEVLMLSFLAFMVMASPLSYVHHVIFLFPGAVLAWGRMSRSGLPQHVRDGFLLIMCILVHVASLNFPAFFEAARVPKALRSVNLFALIGLLLLSLLAARLLWRREVAHEASRSAARRSR